MKELRFFRWPLIILLVGVVLQFIGGLFKIRHWPMADEMITISTIICAIAIVFAIFRIALLKKSNP